MGFITRGRGVTVHFADCAQVHQCDVQRRVDVEWEGEINSSRKVRITVHSQDKIGLLANMSQAITGQGANIVSAQCRTSSLGKAVNIFELTITDARQLDKVKRHLEMIAGVTKVERITHLVHSIENDMSPLADEVATIPEAQVKSLIMTIRIPASLIAFLVSALLFALVLTWGDSPVKAGEPPYVSHRSEEESKTIQVYKQTNEAVVFITTITLAVDPYDM